MTEPRTTQLLVERYAPFVPSRAVAICLPIPRPDYHELPPSLQAELARRLRGRNPQLNARLPVAFGGSYNSGVNEQAEAAPSP
jgi:hypothetical protein